MYPRPFPLIAALLATLLLTPMSACSQSAASSSPISIASRKKPDTAWKQHDALSVDALLGESASAHTAPALSRYGGLKSVQHEATGFFRVAKIKSRWWFIDPDGHPMIRMGLNAVYRRTRSAGTEVLPAEVREHVQAQGGRLWAAQAVKTLNGLGFNGLGRWSENDIFAQTGSPYPYTSSLSFMVTFGETLGVIYEKYGHTGYRSNCIPVFHPDFPAFCDTYARESTEHLRDDPYLVGHYTDNEMPARRDMLDITLALDPDDNELKYNREEAWRWFRARRGADVIAQDATAEDNQAYLGHVYNRYYQLTSEALHRHDPNHLVIGSRLHGAGLKIKPVVAAAGAHLDVMTFNTYGYWSLPEKISGMWADTADRPFLISEFCIKGEDTLLDNTKGAGWIVRTQRERGLWYQNFLITLLKTNHCVGWDYFKYRDDVDVNKGVLTLDFKPHHDFAQAVKQVHESAYRITDQLDRDTH